MNERADDLPDPGDERPPYRGDDRPPEPGDDRPPELAQTMTHAVRITVVDVLESGQPPCGYRVGDSWTVTDFRAPEGMCMWALNALAPFLATLRFGGVLPWESEEDRTVVCCPDPANPVVFELCRVG